MPRKFAFATIAQTSRPRTTVCIVASLLIAACSGQTSNLAPVNVSADSTQRLSDNQSLLACTNAAGEAIGNSVFELSANGDVYRDGQLKTDQDLYSRTGNADEYTYELSWLSLVGDTTSRYDYVHHERDWLYDPGISGEAFIGVEQRGEQGLGDIVTFFEEGTSGESAERCGNSEMTDRGFLVCTEAGPLTGPTVSKRKLARYDTETNELFIDDHVENLSPGNDAIKGEQLTELGDGWVSYQLETSQSSFVDNNLLVTKSTTEFNTETGIVRSYESRKSPTPHVVSCRQ